MRLMILTLVLLSSVVATAADPALAKAPRCKIQFMPKCQYGDMEQGVHCVAKLNDKLELLTDANGTPVVDAGDDYVVMARGQQIAQFRTTSAEEQMAKLKDLVDSGKCAPSKATCAFRIAANISSDARARTTTDFMWVTRGSDETLFESFPITTNDNDPGSREAKETDVIGGAPAKALIDAKLCATIQPMP